MLSLVLLLVLLTQKASYAITEEECNRLRSNLKYNLRPHLPCGEPFERLTLNEMLQRPEFYNYSRPFVMTGSIEGYEPLKDLDWLAEMFGDNVADFYPFNELNIQNHPLYLFRFRAGIEELKKMPGEGLFGDQEITHPSAKAHPAKYLQVGLSQRDWSKLPIYEHVWLSQEFYTCMSEDLQDEYFVKTHWKIILIGQPGAGMFNHADSLRSSSWHLHVTGRKWWRVCYEDGCFEDILDEGDNLFYPRDWYHTTQCLSMPTTTLTSTILTEHNKLELIDELWKECVQSEHGFHFSGKLCDALEVCYKALDHTVKPWRDYASWELIQKRDSPDSWKTNYHFNVIHGDSPKEQVTEDEQCADEDESCVAQQ